MVTVRVAGQPNPVQVGQLQLTDFVNPAGLQPLGENLLAETVASGPAQTGTPGQNGLGMTTQGSVEASNVNVVEELVNMIETAARLRNEFEGDLDRRPDARIRQQPAVMKHLFTIAAPLTLSLLAAGCASLQEDGGREFEPSWPEEAVAPKAIPGAIFAQGTDVTLWNNVTARNVGDTLTIRLAESTEAEKSATTTASKSSTAALTGPDGCRPAGHRQRRAGP